LLASRAEAAGLDCDKAETDADLLTCAKQDLALAQTRLDQAVAQSTAALPPQANALFTAAHRAWVAYRDADCKWNAYDPSTGMSYDLIQTACLADLTNSRAEEVEAGLGAQ
jgi:uncharacterized protein YecT (DUF1311 family)